MCFQCLNWRIRHRWQDHNESLSFFSLPVCMNRCPHKPPSNHMKAHASTWTRMCTKFKVTTSYIWQILCIPCFFFFFFFKLNFFFPQSGQDVPVSNKEAGCWLYWYYYYMMPYIFLSANKLLPLPRKLWSRWTIICVFRLCLRLNRFLQNWQTNGFSPVCINICLSRYHRERKILSQTLQDTPRFLGAVWSTVHTRGSGRKCSQVQYTTWRYEGHMDWKKR